MKSSWLLTLTVLPSLLVAVSHSAFAADAAGRKDRFTTEARSYWAFQPVASPKVPLVRDSRWVRNPIDAFILSQLEAKGLRPSSPTDRVTLLRRVTLDLVGLPPTPDEVEAFLKDLSPEAYEKVVDRLLQSPHYGERWARHWLDLARYAESEGFKADETRPNIWRYRDYVIRSFNQDKPYDRFVREQIAGDELWPRDLDARLATAFNRHYPDESNARNLLQRRQEILNDITDTVGSVFTGLTFGCARCHDHKFDPILQADYYRLQAFFANTRAADDVLLTAPGALEGYQKRLTVWEEKTRDVRSAMNALLEPRRKELVDDLFVKYPPEIQAAILKPDAERTPIEWQMFYKAKPYMNPDVEEVAKTLKGEARTQYATLKAELEKFAEWHPGELPMGVAMVDATRTAPKTHVLSVGVYDAPLQEVEPGFLTILSPAAAKIEPLQGQDSTGRRAALANWLADPKNPLPARVMVNRLWHHHFGRGIVATPSDFGSMGERPTHPQLLDWLAAEFVRQGWSMKAMHRLMVTSSTYRQSSSYNEAAAKVDLQNRLLWHFPRQRLEGEVIRDSGLAVAGLLNTKMGGPSVFPELPPGMESRGGWKVNEDPAERNRRSVYIFVRRNTRYPMLESLDMPDTHESCGRRNMTTTAPQALTLLNSKLTLEWAQAFAARVLSIAGSVARQQVESAYQLAYSRNPDATELQTALGFLERQWGIIAARQGAPLALPTPAPEPSDRPAAAALVDLCHMLMNSNEFVYRN